jgi:hypothetical protein
MHNKNKKEVTKGYLGPDIKAKRTVKTNRRGTTTTKEKEDQFSANHLGHKPADFDYNDKKLWNRKFKSKVNSEGVETKRKEKIVYDDGSKMTKRKQRVIRFGKNKGKVLSTTVSWKDQKRSVKKEYLDAIDTSQLKKGGVKKYETGGFLEKPTENLFE